MELFILKRILRKHALILMPYRSGEPMVTSFVLRLAVVISQFPTNFQELEKYATIVLLTVAPLFCPSLAIF